jgi:hypothetical protein
MFRTAIILCAASLATTATLHAGDVIDADKLNRDQLKAALQAATDNTVIEHRGESKTRAQWRSVYQAQQAATMTTLKQLQAEGKAKFEAAAKALQDEQDKAVAEQNAEELKAFNESE